jgi:hypothetical protein
VFLVHQYSKELERYKKRYVFRHLFSLQNSFYTKPQMDSFTYITPTEVPADNEGGGSGGNSYCVVAQSTPIETPTNMEGGGSGGNSYCVVA